MQKLRKIKNGDREYEGWRCRNDWEWNRGKRV